MDKRGDGKISEVASTKYAHWLLFTAGEFCVKGILEPCKQASSHVLSLLWALCTGITSGWGGGGVGQAP